MSSRISTIACLSLVAGVCAIAQAAPPVTVNYSYGIWSDVLDIAAPNKRNTDYSFDFFRGGVWVNRYNGTTRGAGNDSVRLFDWAGGITNPQQGEPLRVRFANGTTAQSAPAYSRSDTNNPARRRADLGTPSSMSNVGVEIRQNSEQMLATGVGAQYYLSGNDLTLSLPTGFTWAGVPSVTALGSGLQLGSATLGANSSSLIIPVLSNDETDALAGVSISGGTVNYDGTGSMGDIATLWHGYFRVEGDSDTHEGNGDLGLVGFVPTPGTGALALAGGVLAARRRRRN